MKHNKDYEFVRELYFKAKEKVREIEKEIRALQKYFRVKGEGEVNVLKKVYPNTSIQIKNEIKEITSTEIAPCFFIHDGEMKR